MRLQGREGSFARPTEPAGGSLSSWALRWPSLSRAALIRITASMPRRTSSLSSALSLSTRRGFPAERSIVKEGRWRRASAQDPLSVEFARQSCALLTSYDTSPDAQGERHWSNCGWLKVSRLTSAGADPARDALALLAKTGGQASSSVVQRRRRRSSVAEPWDTGQSTFGPSLRRGRPEST